MLINLYALLFRIIYVSSLRHAKEHLGDIVSGKH